MLSGIRRCDVALGDLFGAKLQGSLPSPQSLVHAIGDDIDEGILFRDDHVHQLSAERIQRRHPDRQDGGQEQYRGHGRRLGGKRRRLQPRNDSMCRIQFVSPQKAPSSTTALEQELCRDLTWDPR